MTRVFIATLAALTVVIVVQSWLVDRLKGQVAALKAEAEAAEVWRVQARDDAQRSADRCIEQIAMARLSAQRIETIIERPAHVDPEGCAVRELVPADQLRDALQPRSSAE